MKRIEANQLRQELRGQLQSLKSGDMSPLWEQVGPLIRGGLAGNFTASASPHGGAWPPRKDKLPHPLLRKSLALYNAVTGAGAAGHIADYQPREMAEGVDAGVVVYAAAQSFGFDYGDRALPARQFIDLGEDTIAAIDPLVADFGLGLLAQGGA